MTSLILQQGTRWVFHTIALFSLYLLFAGHNAPGGGFIGGLVGAAAFMLVFVGYGSAELRRVVPVDPEVVLGAGILLAVSTGVGALIAGGEFLASGSVDPVLPLIGEVHLTSVLLFDTGVYLVVVGLALAVLETLGREKGSLP